MSAVAAVLILVAVSQGAGATGRAAEGTIVYRCGDGYANLCRIAAAGGTVTRLTVDGNDQVLGNRVYESPSLSRDGRRLTFAYKSGAYAASPDLEQRRRFNGLVGIDIVALRSDGRRLIALEHIKKCPPGGGACSEGHTGHVIDWNGRNSRKRPAFVADATWASQTSIVAVSARDRRQLLVMPATGCCGRVLLTSDRYELADPALSPTGPLVAVTVRTGINLVSFIGLISLRSRQLTLLTSGPLTLRGPHHSEPAWSPDGRSIVFVSQNRAGDATLARITATPGSTPVSLNTRGMSPTWGATRP